MESLVAKVLTARAKQKESIEKNIRDVETSRDIAVSATKPIVDAISQIKQDVDHSKQITEIAQPALEAPASSIDPVNELPFDVSMERNRWVQELYRNYRNQKKSKTTQLEADLQGNIGLVGMVNMPLLFNYNELDVSVVLEDRRERIVLPEQDLTEGLAALILLPYDDLLSSGIRPSDNDWKIYKRIMKFVDFRKSNSRKVQLLLRHRETEGLGIIQEKRNELSSNGSCAKEKQERLHLLLGSIKAGNTNKRMKQEVQEILDYLLSKRLVTEVMHRRFFEKYNLM